MSDKEPSFGLPKNWDKIPEEERKLLQKPLIFPNSEKLFRRFTVGATLAMTLYMVFFHEYRSSDHCFQPIRQWVAKQKENFFTLNPEDMKYVEEQKQNLKK
ncbi:uncharacterized protein LOC114520240 [Dendronephthya gigantea]|uniref:uncharacterized protein LOC114520240 n=1 Tax=Dendronephthya gigantea TaxID=151771 RepID=UPI00106CF41C|nr:uncharacterized protein LOC114520240 [Dendronephthya gigantea]